MDKQTLEKALMQGDLNDAANLFNDLFRGCVRLGLLEIMEQEVEALCGPSHRRDNQSPYRRAGSSLVSVYLDEQKEQISRPRVRTKSGQEVKLQAHQIASSPQLLFEKVIANISQGQSIRGASRALKGSVSKSEISRMWVAKSSQLLQELRTRKIHTNNWLAIFLDGVFLSKELCIIVAMGVDTQGNKKILDFEQGPSENATVASRLLERLQERGLEEPKNRRLLILRDGSKALNKAVKRFFPNALQQECLVHVHREIRDQIPKIHRADLDLKFKILRKAQGKKASKQAFKALVKFVRKHDAESANNLEARKENLLNFQSLNLPNTLNRTFLNTNHIENVFRNWRAATGNVKKWKEDSSMASRWMASGLLWAEEGFNKIAHSKDLPALEEALEKSLMKLKKKEAKEQEKLSKEIMGLAAPNPAELESARPRKATPPKSPQGDFAPPVPPGSGDMKEEEKTNLPDQEK